jgi:uncharacterized protein
MEIVDLEELDLPSLCQLNNLFAAETSHLSPEEMHDLLRMAFYARGVVAGMSAGVVGESRKLDAFLIGFDQRAEYVNANFAFFRSRWERFVYIDRVITAEHAMRRGLARALYDDLFSRAGAAGHTVVGCEVNLLPTNPGSDAFHARMGFVEVGRAELANGKTVRYLERELAKQRG